jgi:hypothetical protein
MADTANFAPNSDISGVYSPQDFSFNTVNFITAAKQKLELRKIIHEFSFFEDIYSFTVSGYIKLIDSQGFIELLQLTGNEYLELDIGKTKNGKNNLVGKFRVYKLAPRTPSGNMNFEYYTLYFCSEELMLSEQIKVSNSYKGKKISENIKDILVEKLKVASNRIEKIEETTGISNLVVPKVRPFEAISWLSNYAMPQEGGKVGADMLFFETKDGFNFRSLQSLYKSDPYATYKYQQKNLNDKIQDLQEKASTVLNYEIVKSFDMLNEINSGTMANRLMSLDPLTRNFKTTDFNYDKYKEESTSLNSGGATNETKNRFGKVASESYEGMLKLTVGNSNQKDNAYIKEKNFDTKDIFMEKTLPNRTAQMALSNFTLLKISIPGDIGITAGRTIEFKINSLSPKKGGRDEDKFYSGKYLVTAVRHIIVSPTRFQTILEIAKESSPTKYVTRDTSSAEAKSLSGFTDSMNSFGI